MKALKNQKSPFIYIIILLVVLINCSAKAQTMVGLKPELLAEAVAMRFFNSYDFSNQEKVKVAKIDSVICNGTTIGYVFYYKPNGFAIVPKIKEINPYFALAVIRTDKQGKDNYNETFLREELTERYITVTNQNLSTISIQRTEKLWQQLLANASN